MPTYATRADCLAYTPGLTVTDNTGFDVLIEEAERAVDRYLGPIAPRSDTGLKLNPADLPSWAAEAIERATCAQVEWLLSWTREQIGGKVAAPVTAEKGPDFEVQYAVSLTTAGKAPDDLAPRAARELVPLRPWIRRLAA